MSQGRREAGRGAWGLGREGGWAGRGEGSRGRWEVPRGLRGGLTSGCPPASMGTDRRNPGRGLSCPISEDESVVSFLPSPCLAQGAPCLIPSFLQQLTTKHLACVRHHASCPGACDHCGHGDGDHGNDHGIRTSTRTHSVWSPSLKPLRQLPGSQRHNHHEGVRRELWGAPWIPSSQGSCADSR